MYTAKLVDGSEIQFADMMDGLDFLNTSNEGILERDDGTILAVKKKQKIKDALEEAVKFSKE